MLDFHQTSIPLKVPKSFLVITSYHDLEETASIMLKNIKIYAFSFALKTFLWYTFYKVQRSTNLSDEAI